MVWVAIVFTFWMIAILPLLIIPYIFGLKIGGDIAYFFLKVWSYLFSWMNFIFFRVKGREKIDKNKASIVISNHTSFLDAPAFAIAMNGQCRPLGKIEMTKFPIFGWIYRMNVVLVDRSSQDSRKKSFDELRRTIAKNISILIFPEGTMNRGDTLLQPFYDGAFRLAKQLNVNIQPMVIENAINLMPRSGPFSIKPGTVRIQFLDPVSPENYSEKDLKEHCFQIMHDFLNRKNTNKHA
ncbi:MAG: lysophospholipid acyltransferase family protein [Cytophagales bacterium]